MNIDEIEELVYYNLSYGVSAFETLNFLERLDLLPRFE